MKMYDLFKFRIIGVGVVVLVRTQFVLVPDSILGFEGLWLLEILIYPAASMVG